MTPQMQNAMMMGQIIGSLVVLAIVTCFVYPIIKRKTDRVFLWTLFCLIPVLNGLAYLLLLAKTDKDVLARLKALEDAAKVKSPGA